PLQALRRDVALPSPRARPSASSAPETLPPTIPTSSGSRQFQIEPAQIADQAAPPGQSAPGQREDLVRFSFSIESVLAGSDCRIRRHWKDYDSAQGSGQASAPAACAEQQTRCC